MKLRCLGSRGSQVQILLPRQQQIQTAVNQYFTVVFSWVVENVVAKYLFDFPIYFKVCQRIDLLSHFVPRQFEITPLFSQATQQKTVENLQIINL